MKKVCCLFLCMIWLLLTISGCAKAPSAAVTVEIRCDTVLDHMDQLDPQKAELIPEDGVFLSTSVALPEGATALEVLKTALKEQGQTLSYSEDFGYVQGLYGLNEYDCGSQSGWMFSVNDTFPDIGCDSYTPSDGDVVQFRYTCDWGVDLGMEY